MELKVLLKDRFWIVEEEGKKVGTLSLDEDRYVFSTPQEVIFFSNKTQIKKTLGIDFKKINIIDSTPNKKLEVHGYPTSVHPYNEMYDLKRKLPLFTKSEKSKSLYCAGHYIVKFEKGWVKSFCPKLITIERYESKGPFKTESQMKEALWHEK